MNERIEAEIKLLRTRFPNLEVENDWFRIREYLVSASVWTVDRMDLCFVCPEGYPGQKPYGFYVLPAPRLLSGATVNNTAAATEPPFSGEWTKFSWELPEWQATADLNCGFNLLNWALSFRRRLDEGA